MRLHPIGRSLVVQMKKQDKRGVIIMQRDLSEPIEATVMGIGEKVEAPIHEGDLVLIAPYCGSKISGGTEDEPYLLIGEKEVLGILKED